MVGHGGSSAGSYLADPTSPIPSHCATVILFKKCPTASIVTSTLRVTSWKDNELCFMVYPCLCLSDRNAWIITKYVPFWSLFHGSHFPVFVLGSPDYSELRFMLLFCACFVD